MNCECKILIGILVVIVLLGLGFRCYFLRHPKCPCAILNYYEHHSLDNYVMAPSFGILEVIERGVVKKGCDDIEKKFTLFSIVLRLNDIHRQYYPVNGTFISSIKIPGDYSSALNYEGSKDNKRVKTCVKTRDNKDIIIYQISGKLAWTTITEGISNDEVVGGSEVGIGNHLGIIYFGSRVTIYVEDNDNEFEVFSKVGDKMEGCNTVLGKYK